jgi:hypothetical protein
MKIIDDEGETYLMEGEKWIRSVFCYHSALGFVNDVYTTIINLLVNCSREDYRVTVTKECLACRVPGFQGVRNVISHLRVVEVGLPYNHHDIVFGAEH